MPRSATYYRDGREWRMTQMRFRGRLLKAKTEKDLGVSIQDNLSPKEVCIQKYQKLP